MAIKGYVVRGTDRQEQDRWASADVAGFAFADRREAAAMHADLDVAIEGWAFMHRLCHDVSIYRVHDDGREERLPSYEEALAKVESLTDESAAGWAIAKARLKIIEEQAAAIERLKSDVALAADPQVLRYATLRASEAERVNWLLQGLADKVTGAAADVDLPAPLREAVDALGKASRCERVPPAITRAIPAKDAEHVGRIGFELLTCSLCWDPKARLLGNLTAAQIADAAVGAMVAGGLSVDEAHLSRIRVVETLLRDGDAALREAAVYADEGEPIAERVRVLAADRDAFRANASTWRTTADSHCNTIAERDKEIERLRTTERPEEKTLREAVAGMRANISQDEREGIHGFADVSVALDALHRALWGPNGRLAGHVGKDFSDLATEPTPEDLARGAAVFAQMGSRETTIARLAERDPAFAADVAWLNLDPASTERHWQGAMALLRARGVNVDAMLAQAAKNLEGVTPEVAARPPLTMIVAIARGGVIGKAGGLPWPRISEDLRHFKAATMGHTLIVGRRTAQSLPALPGRRLVVLSRDEHRGALSLDDALAVARETDPHPVVIGGAEVYRAALPYVTRILLTEIDADHEGDTFFHLDRTGWRETERRTGDTPGVSFVTLERAPIARP